MNKGFVFLVLIAFSTPFVVFGGQAYFSTQVDRTANINVAKDSNSVLTLTPSSSYGVVALNSNDELEISTSFLGASAMNKNLYLQLGSSTDPSTDYAFTMTNNSGGSVTLDMSFTKGSSFNTGTTDRVIFTVEDGGGNIVSFAEDSSASVTLSAGETAYVVVEIDARGITSGTLNGTLNIKGG